jgi:hypothetical protein
MNKRTKPLCNLLKKGNATAEIDTGQEGLVISFEILSAASCERAKNAMESGTCTHSFSMLLVQA